MIDGTEEIHINLVAGCEDHPIVRGIKRNFVENSGIWKATISRLDPATGGIKVGVVAVVATKAV